MTRNLVEKRKRLGAEEDDPLQTLIRHKYPMSEIARFIATILFASVTSTANVFAWMLIFLDRTAQGMERSSRDRGCGIADGEVRTHPDRFCPVTSQRYSGDKCGPTFQSMRA
ncbi:hypothetical protein B0H14DRAFT_2707844 [Mycena olivaceomarginata]|nr:hypothetical protein B0H14DRAFT_2707844 [Mycena olivaceomarginata]